MAVENGNATDHVDLFNKLYTFLTSNADLVNAGQQWARVTSVGLAPPLTANSDALGDDGISGAVMLKGPGLAGADEIYVSMYLYDNTALDRQMLYLMGHNGVLADNDTYQNHINSSPRKAFPVWRQAMEYWFIASGRRFMGVVKLGTVYEVFYCGFYLPYALPDGNPYPLMIGGTTAGSTSNVGQETTGDDHRAFVDPWERSPGSLTFLTYAGNWVNARHDNSTNNVEHAVHPFFAAAEPRELESNTDSITPPSDDWMDTRSSYLASQRPLLGGGYLLTPLTLHGTQYHTPVADPGVHGIMDGLHHVTGSGNLAENIIQVGGVDHLVLHNVYRTTSASYFTMALE